MDKLISQVSLAFRDKYKNDLISGPFRMVNFGDNFNVCGLTNKHTECNTANSLGMGTIMASY